MFELEIGGKTYKAEVSFYTAQLYEAEFQADLIKDFFGVQANEGMLTTDDEGDIATIDFTKINWLAATKAMWAAIKTADDSAPSYTAWMKKTSGANMWLVREQIALEIADCFFRAEAPAQGGAKE